MDTSKYNIDVDGLFQQLVPPFWLTTPETGNPKEIWVSYLHVISSAFDQIKTLLYSKAENLRDFLTPTGQHLSLEYFLNDLYDNIHRRINLTENDLPMVDQIWYKYGELDLENKVWYKYGESDPAPKTFYKTVENMAKYHFTVHIPAVLSLNQDTVRGLINPYVANGYNFNIVTF
jgi:hypothetical protein